jgi:hypothetical protein
MRPVLSARLVRAFLCVSIISILVLPFVAAAQTAPKPPPPPARLRFLFLDETPGFYALKLDEKNYRRVSANPYEISAPYTPASVEPMEIYKTSRTIDPATGEPRRIRIARFVPPNNTPSALVIVTPRPPAAPDAPLDFKVEIIDCNPADFPGGSIRIVNRGRGGMAAQFGETRIIVQPGETKVVRPKVDHRNRMLSRVAAEEASGWRVLSKTFAVLEPTERVFGILIYSPGGMRHTRTPQEIAEFGPPKPGHFWLTFSDRL